MFLQSSCQLTQADVSVSFSSHVQATWQIHIQCFPPSNSEQNTLVLVAKLWTSTKKVAGQNETWKNYEERKKE